MNDLFLRACRREPVPRPPVWMMRQAGRYLPEYRAVRAKADFLTMCHTPELATEVTLQPVDLLGVDAAIIFSDILVIPAAMGMDLTVDEGIGPRLGEPVRSLTMMRRLHDVEPEDGLKFHLDALRMTRRALNGRVPLIGFAGAPWTLFAYMVEGKGTKTFNVAKQALFSDPEFSHRLLERLADNVGRFLVAQAAAGAQALQIFDSWAGSLGPREYRTFALPYMARAAKMAAATGVPVICFAPGAGWALGEIAEATGCHVLGTDWHTDARWARGVADATGRGVQGNLDPCALYADPAVIRDLTLTMLSQIDGPGYIANLGHGILPDIPVSHARAFIETVQGWDSREAMARAAAAETRR
ncbi:MAG: uroporphyrinogen decarboxylase [Gemmatimonadaceae bacterium]|nr:uroporphyrinogen decarboxylase [Gemmatimonadaceae bacterium]